MIDGALSVDISAEAGSSVAMVVGAQAVSSVGSRHNAVCSSFRMSLITNLNRHRFDFHILQLAAGTVK